MVEMVVFIKALAVTTLFLALVGGGLGWLGYFLVKKYGDWKYIIKYKVLRRKHNQEDVGIVLEYVLKDKDIISMQRDLILTGVELDRVYELGYIYNEVYRKVKGGNKK